MRYYFKYRVAADLSLPLLICVIVYINPFDISVFTWPGIQARETLGFTLLGTTASMLGFVLAASTFLISHLQNPRFDLLRRSASYEQLPSLVSSNIWRLLITATLSGILPLVNEPHVRPALAILFFSIGWAMIALVALLWVVTKIYSMPTE